MKHSTEKKKSSKKSASTRWPVEGIELNKYSKTITQDPTQPAAQAMLYGIGLTDDDLKKATGRYCEYGL